MEFEWDTAKAKSNLHKHGVGFRDASSIFDEPILSWPDTRRDYGEDRVVALGVAAGQVLKVIFTRRGQRVRIISAWRASSDEAATYRTFYA